MDYGSGTYVPSLPPLPQANSACSNPLRAQEIAPPSKTTWTVVTCPMTRPSTSATSSNITPIAFPATPSCTPSRPRCLPRTLELYLKDAVLSRTEQLLFGKSGADWASATLSTTVC